MVASGDLGAYTPHAPAPIRVVRMRPSDIEGVARLEKACHALAWSANAYATELNNPNAFYAVAKTEDGSLAGYGGIWVVMDEFHVTTLGTDPALRGRKVAERILLVLVEEAIERGATRGTLEVRQSNAAAIGLYRKYGFAEVAMRRAYYSDNGENALIMWVEGLVTPEYAALLAERKAAFEQPA